MGAVKFFYQISVHIDPVVKNGKRNVHRFPFYSGGLTGLAGFFGLPVVGRAGIAAAGGKKHDENERQHLIHLSHPCSSSLSPFLKVLSKQDYSGGKGT
jgi:hypothetical protein